MAVMLVTGGFAAIGSVGAAENAEFDGEAVDASDAINTTYVAVGDNINNTVAMTDDQSVSAGGSVTYSSAIHPESVSINSSSGSGTLAASVDDNGDILVEETGGTDSATLEELHVTYDAAQYPYVLPSDGATPVDENYTGTSSVTFNDQQTDGERVTVSAAHNESFFVVFHETSDDGNAIVEDDDGEMVSVGSSAELNGGEYGTINVDLDEQYENDMQLNAMLHTSNDGEIGEPIEESGVVSQNGQLTIGDTVMSSESDLLVGPASEETQTYMVYHPDMVVDTNITTTNGELNESEYEPEEFDETQFEVVFERSTTYESLSLSSLHVEVTLDTIAFNDIEEVTEVDPDTIILNEISESDDLKTYQFDIVEPNSSSDYTVQVNGTANAVDADEAVSAGSVQDPDGGAQSAGTVESYAMSSAGGAPFFADFGDFGALELVLGGGVLLVLIGGLLYARDESGRMGASGYSAYMGSFYNLPNLAWIAFGGVGVTMVVDYFTDFNVWSDLVVGSLGLPEITPLIAGAAIVMIAIGVNVTNTQEMG